MYFNVNLLFNGNCEEAFDFYHEVFGGEKVGETVYYHDVDPEVDEAHTHKIFYTELMLGEFILRGQDNISQGSFLKESNTILNLDFDSKLVGEEIYKLLSENATIIEPLQPMMDGLTYAKFIDQFDIKWEIYIHA